MAQSAGGIALDLEFLPRGGGLFVRFSVGSKEYDQWGRVFQAFKGSIPLHYRTVIAKEPQWVWEVGPMAEADIEVALSEVFDNFAFALSCWRESPTLPGFDFVKESTNDPN